VLWRIFADAKRRPSLLFLTGRSAAVELGVAFMAEEKRVSKYTYSDPYLSLWQSAAADVQRKRASSPGAAEQQRKRGLSMLMEGARPAPDDLMSPVHVLAGSAPEMKVIDLSVTATGFGSNCRGKGLR
jgi:hypothetical protein